MRISNMIDYEFERLLLRIEKLEAENKALRSEKSELLGQAIAAQNLATSRMIRSLIGLPLV